MTLFTASRTAGRSTSRAGPSTNPATARKVEGHAVPTGRSSGSLKVRIFVTRRIALTYETTYELQGPAAAPSPAVTPR